MTATPEWVAKTLAAFDAISGWLLLSLAAAGMAMLYAPIRVGEVDLVQIQRDWGSWILVATILFGFLTLAKLAKRVEGWITGGLQRHDAARVRKEREAEILAHLDTLSPGEKNILRECISGGQRTITVSMIHSERTGAVHALAGKGLVEFASATTVMNMDAVPFIIQTFVWDELQRRSGSFLLVYQARSAAVNRKTRERHDFSRAELDQIEGDFPNIIERAIQEVFGASN